MSRLFILSVFFCALCGLSHATESKPNFLLIIADDLCWRDLGYEGSPDVKTPIRQPVVRPHAMRFTQDSIRFAAVRIQITLASMMEPRACSRI
ncbi:MAG: hypothetical protein NTV80_05680 [Verrucomicrobia bacterium]|nr:hypothetical protein [Verrucomicrobiota bacterium]